MKEQSDSPTDWVQQWLPDLPEFRIKETQQVVHGMRLLALSAQRNLSPTSELPWGEALREWEEQVQFQRVNQLHAVIAHACSESLWDDSCVCFLPPDSDPLGSWDALLAQRPAGEFASACHDSARARCERALGWAREWGINLDWIFLWETRVRWTFGDRSEAPERSQRLLAKGRGQEVRNEALLDALAMAMQCGNRKGFARAHAESIRQGVPAASSGPRLRWLLQHARWFGYLNTGGEELGKGLGDSGTGEFEMGDAAAGDAVSGSSASGSSASGSSTSGISTSGISTSGSSASGKAAVADIARSLPRPNSLAFHASGWKDRSWHSIPSRSLGPEPVWEAPWDGECGTLSYGCALVSDRRIGEWWAQDDGPKGAGQQAPGPNPKSNLPYSFEAGESGVQLNLVRNGGHGARREGAFPLASSECLDSTNAGTWARVDASSQTNSWVRAAEAAILGDGWSVLFGDPPEASCTAAFVWRAPTGWALAVVAWSWEHRCLPSLAQCERAASRLLWGALPTLWSHSPVSCSPCTPALGSDRDAYATWPDRMGRANRFSPPRVADYVRLSSHGAVRGGGLPSMSCGESKMTPDECLGRSMQRALLRSSRGKKGNHGWQILGMGKPSGARSGWGCLADCGQWPGWSLMGGSILAQGKGESVSLVNPLPLQKCFQSQQVIWVRAADGMADQTGVLIPLIWLGQTQAVLYWGCPESCGCALAALGLDSEGLLHQKCSVNWTGSGAKVASVAGSLDPSPEILRLSLVWSWEAWRASHPSEVPPWFDWPWENASFPRFVLDWIQVEAEALKQGQAAGRTILQATCRMEGHAFLGWMRKGVFGLEESEVSWSVREVDSGGKASRGAPARSQGSEWQPFSSAEQITDREMGGPERYWRLPDLAQRREDIAGYLDQWETDDGFRLGQDTESQEEWIAQLWRQAWQGQVSELRQVVTSLLSLPRSQQTTNRLRGYMAQAGLPWTRRLPSSNPRRSDILSALGSSHPKRGTGTKRWAAKLLGWDPDTLTARMRDLSLEGSPAVDSWSAWQDPDPLDGPACG